MATAVASSTSPTPVPVPSSPSSPTPRSHVPETGNMIVQEARQTAIRIVAELFTQPEDLHEKLEMERKLAQQKKQAIESKLKSLVQNELEDSKQVLQLLNESARLIRNCRMDFKSILDVCADTAGLVEDWAIIEDLNSVRTNLLSTRRELHRMMAIPQRVGEIKAILADDNNILVAYEQIKELEKMRQAALFAARQQPNEYQFLQEEFKEVDGLTSILEKSLWTLSTENFLDVGQETPELLVKCMQIIVREEKADKKLLSAQSSGEVVLSQNALKEYRKKFFEKLNDSIQRRFKKILDPCLKDLTKFFKETERLLYDLEIVSSDVSPCVPPSFEIFDFFIGIYHHQFTTYIETVSNGDVTTKEILSFVEWVNTYEKKMADINSGRVLQPPLMDSINHLITRYRDTLQKLMEEWSNRIIQMDQEAEIDQVNGFPLTDAPITLFKFINQQIEVVQTSKSPKLISEVVSECCAVLSSVQKKYTKIINEGKLQFPYLMALVNNNHNSSDYTLELEKKLAAKKLQIDLTPYATGFIDLAYVALEGVERCIFNDLDPAIQELYGKEWAEGEPFVAQIVNTFADYFENDVYQRVPGIYFEKLVNNCAKSMISKMIQKLASGKITWRSDYQSIFAGDERHLVDFFMPRITSKTKQHFEVLNQIKLILESPAESICVYFISATRISPNDMVLPVIEKLIHIRSDLTDDQKKMAFQSCKIAINPEYETQAVSGRKEERASEEPQKSEGGFFSKIVATVEDLLYEEVEDDE